MNNLLGQFKIRLAENTSVLQSLRLASSKTQFVDILKKTSDEMGFHFSETTIQNEMLHEKSNWTFELADAQFDANPSFTNAADPNMTKQAQSYCQSCTTVGHPCK